MDGKLKPCSGRLGLGGGAPGEDESYVNIPKSFVTQKCCHLLRLIFIYLSAF